MGCRERDFNHVPRFAFGLQKAGPDADDVQSRWVMTGKACGLIVENWPQRLWKEPGLIVHNWINNARVGCG
jgi:hypothetical protein